MIRSHREIITFVITNQKLRKATPIILVVTVERFMTRKEREHTLNAFINERVFMQNISSAEFPHLELGVSLVAFTSLLHRETYCDRFFSNRGKSNRRDD